MVKRWFLVGLMLLASLLIVGCGIPKEDYEAVVAERDTAQDEVASLQSDLTAAQSQIQTLQGDYDKMMSDLEATVSTLEADLDKAEGDIQTQQTLNSTLSEELKTVKDPRHFSSITELADWLQKDDTDTKYADVSDEQRAFILQVRALRDGYLLSTLLWEGEAFNIAVIGDSVYAVSSADDRSEWAYHIVALPSHPLPLD